MVDSGKSKSLYELLGINKNASQAQIKTAYKKLALVSIIDKRSLSISVELYLI